MAVFLLACSGPIITDDVVPDSGKDSSMVDSGKMDTGIDGSKDASMDTNMDDSSMDASMDAVDEDGGGGFDAQPLDGGIQSINGLALWLDAAKGVTKNNQNQVSKWADQSANANDATQGTSSYQPVFNASVINGFPALHFSKNSTSSFTIADASSLQWGTGDFVIAIVARFDNNAQNGEFGNFFLKADNTSGVVFFANDVFQNDDGLTGAIDGNNSVDVTNSYSDNTARLYAFRRTGSTLELRVNGSQVGSSSQMGNVDVSAANNPVYIGDYQQQTPLDGDIAELVAVKGISSQDLQSLEAFLKSKYNL